ncbi:G1 family glutamic endopeptidase [Acidianus brierleyi]|uniref:Peptidase A4 n=1 Tax=Acidianus brierleyi TaxID=41673 RepID=A0A2U9ICI1_9CREN|nr:G1 family glutamic endopeptidase [Acidianus brierleyi]AWR93735.1 hypothetical protein DFR85_03000 [Acidianus brierleyi]
MSKYTFYFGEESLNWAGYVVSSNFSNPEPEVTDIDGSWIVQSVKPTMFPTYSAQWIGIGGFFSGDKSLIQTGTLSYSEFGQTYYCAWYEILPAAATPIQNFTVKPGDTIYSSIILLKVINSTTQEWKITLDDVTEHEYFSITLNYSSSLLSGEWIEERPEVFGHLSTLADFGIAYYGEGYTNIALTNYVTIDGTIGPIGAFPYESITMTNDIGEPIAVPGNLLYNGTSFNITYEGLIR